jgi:hypothetical protein
MLDGLKGGISSQSLITWEGLTIVKRGRYLFLNLGSVVGQALRYDIPPKARAESSRTEAQPDHESSTDELQETRLSPEDRLRAREPFHFPIPWGPVRTCGEETACGFLG